MAKTNAQEGNPFKTPKYPNPEHPGLYMVGTVASRRRKLIKGKDGKPDRFLIQLSVITPGGYVTSERWSDSPKPTDSPEPGECITLPVRMTIFATKSGTRAALQWGPETGMEEF